MPRRRLIGVAVPLRKSIEDDYEDLILGSHGVVRGCQAFRAWKIRGIEELFKLPRIGAAF